MLFRCFLYGSDAGEKYLETLKIRRCLAFPPITAVEVQDLVVDIAFIRLRQLVARPLCSYMIHSRHDVEQSTRNVLT